MGYGTMPPSGPPQHPSNPNYGYPGYPPAAAPQVPRWQPGAAVAIMFVAMVMPWIQSPVGMIQADGSYFTILKLLIAVGSNQRGGSGVIFIWSIPLISWFLALCGLGRFSWNRVALALGGIFGALFCLLILMGIMSSGNGQGLSVVGVGFFLYLGGAIFAVVASATKA
ncbi:MAG: hypothetical protein JST35_04270 [Armatimonadetes bacterium]|nr:hypothetical protein [Armatimonadota bacterium]